LIEPRRVSKAIEPLAGFQPTRREAARTISAFVEWRIAAQWTRLDPLDLSNKELLSFRVRN
jgi:hypothetical protein